MNVRHTDVALILPVSGRPLLVREAIDSVMEGSLVPASVIVVVDSTGDEKNGDLAAVRSARDRYGGSVRFRILETNGAGPAGARNAGVSTASERYIAFLDSDDLWRSAKLETQLRFLQKRPHLAACITQETWIKNGTILRQPDALAPGNGRFLKAAFHHCLIACSAIVIEREVFLALNGFDESFPVCEDYEFWIRYLVHHPIGLVPEELSIKRSGNWKQLSREEHSIDRFRVKGLIKAAGTLPLRDDEFAEAKRAAFQKLAILKKGGGKYGTIEEIEPLEREVISLFGTQTVNGPDAVP